MSGRIYGCLIWGWSLTASPPSRRWWRWCCCQVSGQPFLWNNTQSCTVETSISALHLRLHNWDRYVRLLAAFAGSAVSLVSIRSRIFSISSLAASFSTFSRRWYTYGGTKTQTSSSLIVGSFGTNFVAILLCVLVECDRCNRKELKITLKLTITWLNKNGIFISISLDIHIKSPIVVSEHNTYRESVAMGTKFQERASFLEVITVATC